jgi:protein phosphatase
MAEQTLNIPELSVVVLVGASGAGKSTFARRWFLPTEIVSSDFCRALIADDENDQAATPHAFEVLHTIVAKRLELGKLTVIDATNLYPEDRKQYLELAREYHAIPVAIALALPASVCLERNATRADRTLREGVIRRQAEAARRSLRQLEREGFRYVYVLRTPEEVDTATVVRTPLRPNMHRADTGPFDIIGDVHGCLDELLELLRVLGWQVEGDCPMHPDGRKAVFVGDLIDRGPNSVGVLQLVRRTVEAGVAYAVIGNHDEKLIRYLRGRKVQVSHGLERTLQELEAHPEPLRHELRVFLESLPSHLVLDNGKLVVAHAGIKQPYIGRSSPVIRDFCLYGETTGESDEFGLPVRLNWAADYRGSALVVYGHTPNPDPLWQNNTVNIDTGCVFGGALTALRYPERETVSVPAKQVYYAPVRPTFARPELGTPTLRYEDVAGKQYIQTRLHGTILLREDKTAPALEALSRFGVDLRWVIYLPPTMAPVEASNEPDLLEHPDEAFAYYRHQGVHQVVCEQKHMGSRAIAIVCRDTSVPRKRFGVPAETLGVVYTRTGRRFFNDPAWEAALLQHLRDAATAAGLWDALDTDWLLLDAELMPWSAKAQELLRVQYAPTAAAGIAALQAAIAVAPAELQPTLQARLDALQHYRDAYRRYCWQVHSPDDLRFAPFHLLASEGAVHANKPHTWHMEQLARLCEAGNALGKPILQSTEWKLVDTTDPQSQSEAIRWFLDYTAQGGEGIVVKPLEFVARGKRGLAQPALKVRGREYLRIIYGAEYTLHLDALRERSVGRKRTLAAQEFALGIEALERFIRYEPLTRVHQCVLGILALEAEPVDPRL